jgi:sugar O-acyltransferase (sialic acid O-acetyltransferase NeuD family)
MQSPSATPPDSSARLVIFGLSNILSDLLDAAYSAGVGVKAIVADQPEAVGPRDLSVHARLDAYATLAPRPLMLSSLDDFSPEAGELYLLGPTTPQREQLASRLVARFGLRFWTLVHPRASVSPFASLGEGVFIGANSVVAAGAVLEEHVFVNRGVTIGHDTHIGAYSRLQPGVNLGGLVKVGRGVSAGLGANVLERLHVGDGAVIASGAVVLEDVPPRVMVAGVPARVQKQLA